MIKVLSRGLIVLAVAALWNALAHGDNPPAAHTVIVVEKLHCAGCAKRIGTKLQTVSGVSAVQYDLEKKLLFIHPQPGRVLSPRALWVAVEQGGDRPLLLQGPSGSFNTKPQS